MRVEDLIRNNPIRTERGDFLGGAGFILRVYADQGDGELHVYIHPEGRNGDTEDFIVKGNVFFPKNYADKK